MNPSENTPLSSAENPTSSTQQDASLVPDYVETNAELRQSLNNNGDCSRYILINGAIILTQASTLAAGFFIDSVASVLVGSAADVASFVSSFRHVWRYEGINFRHHGEFDQILYSQTLANASRNAAPITLSSIMRMMRFNAAIELRTTEAAASRSRSRREQNTIVSTNSQNPRPDSGTIVANNNSLAAPESPASREIRLRNNSRYGANGVCGSMACIGSRLGFSIYYNNSDSIIGGAGMMIVSTVFSIMAIVGMVTWLVSQVLIDRNNRSNRSRANIESAGNILIPVRDNGVHARAEVESLALVPLSGNAHGVDNQDSLLAPIPDGISTAADVRAGVTRLNRDGVAILSPAAELSVHRQLPSIAATTENEIATSRL